MVPEFHRFHLMDVYGSHGLQRHPDSQTWQPNFTWNSNIFVCCFLWLQFRTAIWIRKCHHSWHQKIVEYEKGEISFLGHVETSQARIRSSTYRVQQRAPLVLPMRSLTGSEKSEKQPVWNENFCQRCRFRGRGLRVSCFLVFTSYSLPTTHWFSCSLLYFFLSWLLPFNGGAGSFLLWWRDESRVWGCNQSITQIYVTIITL